VSRLFRDRRARSERKPQRRATRSGTSPAARKRRARRAGAPAGRLRTGRIGAGVLAIALAAGALLSERVVPVPRLRAVHLLGATRLSDAEIGAAAGVARGDAMREIDAGRVAERLAANGWVRRARAARLPIGTLVLALEEREPRAVLAGPEPRAVDAEGTPFAPVASEAFPELPRLVLAARVAPSEPSAALAAAIALADRLASLGLPPAEAIEIAAEGDPTGSSLRLRGLAPRFVLGRDPEAALARLAAFVDAAPPEALLAGSIDLRFQDQAVLREPSPEGAAQAADPRRNAGSSTARGSG
jgi:cell division protein FtsQ